MHHLILQTFYPMKKLTYVFSIILFSTYTNSQNTMDLSIEYASTITAKELSDHLYI